MQLDGSDHLQPAADVGESSTSANRRQTRSMTAGKGNGTNNAEPSTAGMRNGMARALQDSKESQEEADAEEFGDPMELEGSDHEEAAAGDGESLAATKAGHMRLRDRSRKPTVPYVTQATEWLEDFERYDAEPSLSQTEPSPAASNREPLVLTNGSQMHHGDRDGDEAESTATSLTAGRQEPEKSSAREPNVKAESAHEQPAHRSQEFVASLTERQMVLKVVKESVATASTTEWRKTFDMLRNSEESDESTDGDVWAPTQPAANGGETSKSEKKERAEEVKWEDASEAEDNDETNGPSAVRGMLAPTQPAANGGPSPKLNETDRATEVKKRESTEEDPPEEQAQAPPRSQHVRSRSEDQALAQSLYEAELAARNLPAPSRPRRPS